MKLGVRELLFLSLMLGLMGSSYFFVFRPAAEKREARRAEIAAKFKALSDLRQTTAGIGDVERKIAELEQAIRFFERKLPAQKEVDSILKQIWELADRNALQTRTIKTLKAGRTAGCSEQPIQMTLAGDFRGFYSFLLELEKLPRLTQVTQMKLEKSPDRDGSAVAQMTMSIFFEAETASVQR